jgi:hypothetical protein
MTTETGDEICDFSKIMINRIRIIRSICLENSEITYTRTNIIRERLPINHPPTKITEEYMLKKIGGINLTGVLRLLENQELNEVASVLFSNLAGRMDETRALREILRIITLSRTLDPAFCPHE